jgi:ribulose kinase
MSKRTNPRIAARTILRTLARRVVLMRRVAGGHSKEPMTCQACALMTLQVLEADLAEACRMLGTTLEREPRLAEGWTNKQIAMVATKRTVLE